MSAIAFLRTTTFTAAGITSKSVPTMTSVFSRHMSAFEGQVKWFNTGKGFGFIAGDDGRDIFAHQTSIKSPGYRFLNEGERVSYDIEDGERGPAAINICGPGGSELERSNDFQSRERDSY